MKAAAGYLNCKLFKITMNMDSLPRTPVNKSPVKHQIASEMDALSQDSSGDFKVHPHGLSNRKRLLHERETSPMGVDMSLDCIVRTNHSNNLDNVSESDTKDVLDNIDINKMFGDTRESNNHSKYENNQDPVLKLNHSPIKVDISSPIRLTAENVGNQGSDEPVYKRPKLELDFAPNLQKPSNMCNEALTSPVAIEMIETKSNTNKFEQQQDERTTLEIQEAIIESVNSPDYEYSSIDNRQRNVTETPKRDNSDDTPDLHKLTPLYSSGSMSNELHYEYIEPETKEKLEQEHDSFKIVTSRNEDLVDQLHILNKKVNRYLSNYESSEYKLKLLNADYSALSEKYENEIEIANEEVTKMHEERSKLKERAEKLKKRLSETKDEVQMLNQNQRILQDKYDAVSKETDKWRSSYEEIKNKYRSVEDDSNSKLSKIESLSMELESLNSKIIEYENQEAEFIKERNSSEKIYNDTKEQLFVKSKELNALQDTLDRTISEQQGNNGNLLKQVEELLIAKSELEINLEEQTTEYSKEKQSLREQLNTTEYQVTESKKSLFSADEKIILLQTQLTEKSQNLSSLNKEYEESNDHAEINKAEVEQLNTDINYLKESETRLKKTIINLEANIEEWSTKYQTQTVEFEKTSLELESLQLKSNNIESEHLAELEQLHENLSSLQHSFRENTDLISNLKKENSALLNDKEVLAENNTNSNESSDKNEKEIASLKKKIEEWKEKLQSKEQDTNKRLKLLAEDLYVQYSSKHEQKVKLLKKGYDSKYESKLDQLSLQNQGLVQEIEQIKHQLSSERKEKQTLLELLDKK